MRKLLMVAVLLASRLDAQGTHAMPLAFALPDSAARARLDADWWAKSERGTEWAYCVTEWAAGRTAAGDTVFYVQQFEDAPTTKANGTAVSYGCDDKQGRPLPTIHAHMSGNCSPSRDDIEAAVKRRADFEMITCGPGITNGYVAKQFAARQH